MAQSSNLITNTEAINALQAFRTSGQLYPYVTSTHKDPAIAIYGLGKHWGDWKENERPTLWNALNPNTTYV